MMQPIDLMMKGMADEFPAEELKRDFYSMFDDPHRAEQSIRPADLITTARKNFMTQKFGVEIELDKVSVRDASILLKGFFAGAGDSRQGSKYFIKDYNNRSWEVKGDSSVPNGFEIASPPLTVRDIYILRPLLFHLKKLGAKTGKKTGIHIHIGTQEWSPNELVSLLFLYSNYAAEIDLTLNIKPSRREYCMPIFAFAERMRKREHNRRELKNAWFTQENKNGTEAVILPGETDRRYQTRYREMNFFRYFADDKSIPKNKKTIEFRGFNSTIDEKTLEAYVLFILAFASFAKSLPIPPKLDKNLKKINKSRFFQHLKILMRYYLLIEGDLYESTKKTFTRNFKASLKRSQGSKTSVT